MQGYGILARVFHDYLTSKSHSSPSDQKVSPSWLRITDDCASYTSMACRESPILHLVPQHHALFCLTSLILAAL